MPQTPSFLIPRGLALYNCFVGQRLSLRSRAASATQPVVTFGLAVRKLLGGPWLGAAFGVAGIGVLD